MLHDAIVIVVGVLVSAIGWFVNLVIQRFLGKIDALEAETRSIRLEIVALKADAEARKAVGAD